MQFFLEVYLNLISIVLAIAAISFVVYLVKTKSKFDNRARSLTYRVMNSGEISNEKSVVESRKKGSIIQEDKEKSIKKANENYEDQNSNLEEKIRELEDQNKSNDIIYNTEHGKVQAKWDTYFGELEETNQIKSGNLDKETLTEAEAEIKNNNENNIRGKISKKPEIKD